MGPTLIRHVRDKRPDMKVIFISGYTEDKFRDQLDAGEHIHFLPKPFSLKQLAGKVKEALAGRMTGRQNITGVLDSLFVPISPWNERTEAVHSLSHCISLSGV